MAFGWCFATTSRWQSGVPIPAFLNLVRIRFLKIPIEFFQENFLLCMGVLVGRAVKMYLNNALKLERKISQSLCEVDFSQPLVHIISVIGHVKPVEYGGLHMICFGCGEYGHQIEACSKLRNVAEVPPSIPNPSPASRLIAEFSTAKKRWKRQSG